MPYVHDPETHWLYMVGRVKPGVATARRCRQKVSALLRQAFADTESFSTEARQEALLAKVHVVLTPGGAGIQTHAGGLRRRTCIC